MWSRRDERARKLRKVVFEVRDKRDGEIRHRKDAFVDEPLLLAAEHEQLVDDLQHVLHELLVSHREVVAEDGHDLSVGHLLLQLRSAAQHVRHNNRSLLSRQAVFVEVFQCCHRHIQPSRSHKRRGVLVFSGGDVRQRPHRLARNRWNLILGKADDRREAI